MLFYNYKYSFQLLFLLPFLLSCNSNGNNGNVLKDDNTKINKKLEYYLIDTSNLNQSNYDADVELFSKYKGSNLPITHLPHYVEKGNMCSVYLKQLRDTIDNSPIAGNYFQGKDQIPLFCILVKTNIGKKNSPASIYAHNYPDIFAQGKINHEIGEIDWVFIQPENSNGLAIISGKIFDLEYGKTILVLNNKKGGIEFIQINDIISDKSEKSKLEFYNRIRKFEEINLALIE